MELKGRRVFVRVDFNVPLETSNDIFEVRDDNRIRAAVPTIETVFEKGGKCILASHLGRPKGKPDKKYTMEPVGKRLTELLKKDVILSEDCVGDGPTELSHQLKSGDVLLLENLRFHEGEEKNSVDFANRLAALCDVYISDAFGTLHRAHASTYGLPKNIAEKGMGLLVQRELEFLEPLKDNPKRPFVLVAGGAKVSDKMGILEHFLSKVDAVLIGGAMAYAFLKAQGHEIGESLFDESQLFLAEKFLKSAEARSIKVFLPEDHLVATNLQDTHPEFTEGRDVPIGKMAVDIGPKTLSLYRSAMVGAETIFWNGPMGVFEQPAFAEGTFEVARMIADSNAKKLAGGGDVAAAIAKSGCESRFDFISTGGGATLEYLEGKELPGLKALEVYLKNS